MTDQPKIDGWKALAEAAEKARDLSADHQTPGVWMHLFGDRFVYTRLEDGCRGRRVVGVDCVSSPADNVALDFVAKANPTSILALIAEMERLREALKPFAREAEMWSGVSIMADTYKPQGREYSIGDLRRARAALEAK